MEWIFADIINSTKVPKVVKYIAITLLVGFLEFLFISIAINGVSKFAMPVGISLAIIFFIVYIYLIISIKNITTFAKIFDVTIFFLLTGLEYKNSIVPSLSSFDKADTPSIAAYIPPAITIY